MTEGNELNRAHLYILAGILIAIGLLIFAYKARVVGFPIGHETESHAWKVEARLRFIATGHPVKASLLIPTQSKRYPILDETFVSGNYGIVTTADQANRKAVWSVRDDIGKRTLYYQATIGMQQNAPDEAPRPQKKQAAKAPDFSGTTLEAAEALMKEVKKRSADAGSLVLQLIKFLNRTPPDQNVKLLLGLKPSSKKKVRVAVYLLNHAGVPARMVTGIRLNGGPHDFTRKTEAMNWLEFHDGKRWVSFDVVGGKSPVPPNWFRWCVGSGSPATVEGAEHLRLVFSVRPLVEEALTAAVGRMEVSHPFFLKFSLFSLPVSTQAVYRVLLLVPVGAFLLVLMRNLVGMKTFGTFMPVLIALAFRETGLFKGILIFVMLVALGLAVRFWLERLKLLLVPRLAAVLIVVVGLMTALSIFSKALGGHTGLSVALFPMVILTMTIERMSILVEERGFGEALISGVGSIICAALAYLVMNIKQLEHLVFVFPELLLVLLGMTLILGRYTGYRLMDLYRFRALAKG